MKPSDKLRELGFGNQAIIVGTKRKELYDVVNEMFEEETTKNVVREAMKIVELGYVAVDWNEKKASCDHDWHVPDFGDDVDNEQFATCKKCNAWRE